MTTFAIRKMTNTLADYQTLYQHQAPDKFQKRAEHLPLAMNKMLAAGGTDGRVAGGHC